MTDEELRRLFEETRGYIDQSVRQSAHEVRRHVDVQFENVRTAFESFREGLMLLDEKLEATRRSGTIVT